MSEINTTLSENVNNTSTNRATSDHVSTISSSDLCEAILSALNYFIVLNLPVPTIDIIGTPIWEVDDLTIKKAYREMSMKVHPDKNRSSKAIEAFQSYQCLIKDSMRNAYISEYIDKIKPKTFNNNNNSSTEISIAESKRKREEAQLRIAAERSKTSNEMRSQMVQKILEKREKNKDNMLGRRELGRKVESESSEEESDSEEERLKKFKSNKDSRKTKFGM